MWYLLCREVLRLKGQIPRGAWETLPDLFFYRDPEEVEKEAAEKAAAAAAAEGGDVEGVAADAAAGVAQEWDAGATADAVFQAQPTEQGEWSQTNHWGITTDALALDWSADAGGQDWSAEPTAAPAQPVNDQSGGW